MKALASAPPVYQHILPRRGVARIINETPLSAAVCMVAPYGFGKTLAAISWFNENRDETPPSLVWLTLTGQDNDPHVLDEQLKEADSSIPDESAVLVIDNFEHIHDPGAQRCMKDFIANRLGRWRMIIMSRADIPSVFNDLILKGRIRLITPKELHFNLEETADYFNINDCEASWPEVSQVHEQTDGWPAALNVVLSLSRGGPVAYNEAARAYVTRFFETEIWEGLDEKIKDFLLKTSVLDSLTPWSCRAVTDTGSTLPTIDWLFANGIFISHLNERNTYQYHRVFKAFLQEKLHSSEIDEVALYKRLAWWLYDNGEYEMSLPYFVKAQEYEGLSGVLKIISPNNMKMEDYLTLTGCIHALDVSQLKNYPVIVARMALNHLLTGQLDEMHALLDLYMEWIEPGVLQVSPEEYAEYVWEAGWLCYLDPAEELLNNMKHEEWTNYREYVPHLQVQHRARAAVMRTPSVLRGIRDYSTTIPYVEPFLMKARETGYSVVREEVSVWEMEIMVAEYAYQREEFDKSLGIIRRILTLTENAGMTDLCFVCIALMVKLMRVTNHAKEIKGLINWLESLIMERQERCMLPNLHAFKLINELADGGKGLPAAFEQENKPYIHKPYYFLLYRHFAYTRGLISEDRYNEALLILGNLSLLCQKYNRPMDLIEVNVLTAIAHFQSGHEETAVRYLSDALSGAKQFGYIRIISDDALMLGPIMEYSYKNNSDPYIKRIRLSCKKTRMQTGRTQDDQDLPPTTLTKTELKVLKALKEGMSYEEIALENNIRLSTVKSHAHSVYSKLGVGNRTSAVLVAREAGLIL